MSNMIQLSWPGSPPAAGCRGLNAARHNRVVDDSGVAALADAADASATARAARVVVHRVGVGVDVAARRRAQLDHRAALGGVPAAMPVACTYASPRHVRVDADAEACGVLWAFVEAVGLDVVGVRLRQVVRAGAVGVQVAVVASRRQRVVLKVRGHAGVVLVDARLDRPVLHVGRDARPALAVEHASEVLVVVVGPRRRALRARRVGLLGQVQALVRLEVVGLPVLHHWPVAVDVELARAACSSTSMLANPSDWVVEAGMQSVWAGCGGGGEGRRAAVGHPEAAATRGRGHDVEAVPRSIGVTPTPSA